MKIYRYRKMFIHLKEFIPGEKSNDENLDWMVQKYIDELTGKERINTYED
jgi:hypothetical protein